LEGLVTDGRGIEVWGIDPNPQALQRAEAVALQFRNAETPIQFHPVRSVTNLPPYFDVLISATTADHRLNSLMQVFEVSQTPNLILEKVLTQSVSDADQLLRLCSHIDNTFVNYPRRAMGWHQNLKDVVRPFSPVCAEITGDSWGMATSSLHFIDLIEWWTESRATEMMIEDDNLHWFPSKRDRYLDFSGSLKVHFTDGSELRLVSGSSGRPEGPRVTVKFQSMGKECVISIDESAGLASGGIPVALLGGELTRQSELTWAVVERLLDSGESYLPTLNSVIATHKSYLEMLVGSPGKASFSKDLVPIT
jgi:hypothetical protein